MKSKTFTEAVDLSHKIFYDLNGKRFTFIYRHNKEKCQMIFTAVADCDVIKRIWPQFEIKQDTRQDRFAELIIQYEK